MSSLQTPVHKSGVSANVTPTEGVMEKLTVFFLKYPRNSPWNACKALRLDPRKYAATARQVKHRVKKQWGGVNVQVDPLMGLTGVHRVKLRLQGGVPAGVLGAFLEAAKVGCNGLGVWFRSDNRNGQINYKNNDIVIR